MTTSRHTSRNRQNFLARSATVMALPFLLATVARAAAFQNLDFEQATVVPATAPYTPWDAFQPISSAAALPGWTVMEDDTLCTAVWGQPVGLDETSVALVSPVPPGSGSGPIQGSYSVELYGWAGASSPYFHRASISQTGSVPANARSLRFLIRDPWGLAKPQVFLNGTQISVSPQSSVNGVITMAGDITPFAGTTAELQFLAAGDPAGGASNLQLSENMYYLDSISFSTTVLPEPASLALLALGLCGSLLTRRAPRPSADGSERLVH